MTNRNIRVTDLAYDDATEPPEFPNRPGVGYNVNSIVGGTKQYDGYHIWLASQIIPFAVGGVHSLLHRFTDVTCDGSGNFTFRNGVLHTPFPVVIDVTGIGFIPATDLDDNDFEFQLQPDSTSSAADEVVITLTKPSTRLDSSGTSKNGNRGGLTYEAGKYYTASISQSDDPSGIASAVAVPAGGFPMTRNDTFSVAGSGDSASVNRAGMPAQCTTRGVGLMEFEDSINLTTDLDRSARVTFKIVDADANQVFSVIDVLGTVKVSI
jgi:hypothetical protein